MKKIPQLAVILEGGIVQAIVCTDPGIDLSVAVVDYDISDCGDTIGLTAIPQGDGTSTFAYIQYTEVTKPVIDMDSVFNTVPVTPTTDVCYTLEEYNQSIINSLFPHVTGEITSKIFEAATGYPPNDDDLERCNCPDAGKLAHSCCGWNTEQNRPQYEVGPLMTHKRSKL